jgi:TM2 domain-containing membrane protein YozV
MTTDAQIGWQIHTTYETQKKSLFVAYLFLVFAGVLGAHRFYLRHPGTALIMAALWVFGWVAVLATDLEGLGVAFIGADTIWVLVDIFLIPMMFVKVNSFILADLTRKFSADDFYDRAK